jgi:outer membrane lipoprotein-sorting protein
MRILLFASLLLSAAATAADAPPALEEVLKRYDALMGPENFKAVMSMTSHRDDGTSRTYKMTLLKVGAHKTRIGFEEPASARGQEILRNGENTWIYMPNLKRSLRLASRESFQGGDFNNADVLRANYTQDYSGTVKEDTEKPDTWLLELKSRSKDSAYDGIKLWVKRAPLGVPVRGEYFTSSGKLLRSADFLNVKDFGNKLVRPALVKMRNELATQRYSELFFDGIDTRSTAPDARFTLNDLGR